jgi:hypothetical protein
MQSKPPSTYPKGPVFPHLDENNITTKYKYKMRAMMEIQKMKTNTCLPSSHRANRKDGIDGSNHPLFPSMREAFSVKPAKHS